MTIEDFKDEKLVMFNVDSVQNELLKKQIRRIKYQSSHYYAKQSIIYYAEIC